MFEAPAAPQTVSKIQAQVKYVDTFFSLRILKSIIYSRYNPWELYPITTLDPITQTLLTTEPVTPKGNLNAAMEKLKEALIKFADSNPSLFRHDGFNSYPSLIEQRFSQFFFDFQTPNHPPYAAVSTLVVVFE